MSTQAVNPSMRVGPILPWLILAAVALGAMVYLVFLERPEDMGTSHPAVGKKLSRLNVMPLTGDPPPIREEDLPGRVTLINYWGTWCPPCLVEVPQLAALEKKHRGRDDFRFVSITVPNDDSDTEKLRDETQRFLTNAKIDLPTYTRGDLGEKPGAFAVVDLPSIYPTTIILDQQSVIRGVWNGYRPGYERQMGALVEQLLSPAPK